MPDKKPKTDRDEITVAKSIFDEIVELTEHEPTPKEIRARKGGEARAAKLTPSKRKAIAKKGAEKRWQSSRE
ncbi:MAG: histone H1 [Pyrinomonadaceae bacterium]